MSPNTVAARKKKGRTVLAKETGGMHPGTPPRPFMRPSFDANKERAPVIMAEVLKQELKIS